MLQHCQPDFSRVGSECEILLNKKQEIYIYDMSPIHCILFSFIALKFLSVVVFRFSLGDTFMSCVYIQVNLKVMPSLRDMWIM